MQSQKEFVFCLHFIECILLLNFFLALSISQIYINKKDNSIQEKVQCLELLQLVKG